MPEEPLERRLVRAILHRTGPQHPFRLSRYLLWLDLEYARKHGSKLTSFEYVLGPSVFYIEDFPAFLESIPGVVRITQTTPDGLTRGAFALEVDEYDRSLPPEVETLLEEILSEATKLNDDELNKAVVERLDYRALVEAA